MLVPGGHYQHIKNSRVNKYVYNGAKIIQTIKVMTQNYETKIMKPSILILTKLFFFPFKSFIVSFFSNNPENG